MDEQQNYIFNNMTKDPKFWSSVDFYREQFTAMPKGKNRAHSIQEFVDHTLET